MLLHTINAMRITVILVMGHDRLYSMLKNQFGKEIKIIKLPQSGGVVSRDTAFQRQSRSLTMKRYFYGDTVANCHPSPCWLPSYWFLQSNRRNLFNSTKLTLRKNFSMHSCQCVIRRPFMFTTKVTTKVEWHAICTRQVWLALWLWSES
jgi:hypothetical protein